MKNSNGVWTRASAILEIWIRSPLGRLTCGREYREKSIQIKLHVAASYDGV